MTTQYTSILKLALPVQGELSGTWGDVVNDNITSMVEQAIAGRAVIDSWTANAHTLTTANGVTSESRCAMLEFTDSGTQLTGAGSVVCPTLSKIYIAKNASGQNVTLKTSGGTGILVPNGRTMFLFCDGTNVVEAVTSTTSLQLGTSTTVTAVLDEDNMASNSAVSLATQQSIKAYVDAQVATSDTLAEVLANGNTTGGTDVSVSTDDKVQFRDAAIYINSSADGQLDIVADTEIQIAATTVDVNGILDVSGNIVAGGTVDGRDIATDGTKLDGIEASADVTDTTNVTAAGALMDSEVTNLAQVKAFDSADYATAAQGTTADAALPTTGGAMTGAITTNSTFDGRDVATDGTKLDGIEASADVTDTTNVTAAGALMDSEVTNLAQVKAFDSADYATAAQGTTADAALPKAGGALTGAVTTNSTFDGRDVAADGTKLDGIEASADVTDTTNVVASLTAGSNITIAADGTIASTASGGNETLQQTLAIGNTTTTDTKIQFRDTGLYINSSADGQLDIVADTEVQIAATTVDVNGILDVSGNIVAGGTVDGRDVATDGTKLDGIEASADVTDTANVTAAGALMDSEVTNLAQVKAFDSSDYATAAQGTTADAALPKAGGTMTGTLAFGDNVKATFGDEPNLEIYHSGSHSIIEDVGGGSLFLKGGPQLKLFNDSESAILCQKDGAVTLYHNAVAKVATSATGASVTGTVTMDGLTVDTDTLAVDSTNNRVGIGTTSPSASLHVQKGSAGSSAFPSGDWAAKIFNQTDASTEHGLVVANRWAAAASTAFEVGSLFDDGDGFDTFLKVDGSGQVGIGIASPTAPLHIDSDSVPLVKLDNNTNSTATQFQIYNSNTATSFFGINTFANTNSFKQFGSNGTGGTFTFNHGTSAESMRITSSKRVGIGTTSPAQELHVVGDIVATGNITAFYSDERLKDLIGTIPNALDKVSQLNGYYYTANDTARELGVKSKGVEVGVSAQEIETVLPEIIADSVVGKGYKTVMYEKITPLLIEAVKELTAKVDALETKLKDLEK